ncbi:hypothetical protein ES703_65344 [subsurface metagenome]
MHESVHLLIPGPKFAGVVGIGCHTLQSNEKRILKALNVLILLADADGGTSGAL